MQIESTHPRSVWRVWPLRSARRAVLTRGLTAVVAGSALLLAGCSNGSTSPSTQGAADAVSAQDSAQPNAAPGTKSVAGAPAGAAGVVKSGVPVVSLGPKLTRSASLDLRVRDISAAAARVRAIAAGLQALVLSEQIGKGGSGNPAPVSGNGEPTSDVGGFGTLTLSVPSDKLDTALDQLAKQVGVEVLQRSSSSQDVTSQYVDTQSRLKTMTASVARVRALMSQAKDLGQVVALEGEVSRREADLESLQSQMDALKTSVERSMLAVSLSTPGNEPVTGNGFVTGLRSGWHAFTASASGLFTGVGAVLPFGVFFALVGAPIWWSWRRRASRSSLVPAPAGPVV